ncbi:ATP-binding cassette domain-containing protein [Amycolatopsis pigmentata]|uniref:ATP-binding cassette domain-containing protein n=1 Tax=Amycolatopsis pigmentata TaxID=450801 RepID=A0ABW5FW75_9PSEU
MLRLRDVGKRYGRGAAVLTGVTLEIAPRQMIGVVGTNGSGKSTLMRLVAGLSRPTTGTVEGIPSVGYVPDRFPGGTRMSALSYLRHLGRIGKVSDVDKKATELLERLALEGGPRAPLRELSKGNAQKVGIAQALLGEPELLVLDEPWSGLDPAAHTVLAELLAEAKERGAGVIFTEHRDDLARAHTSEVFELSGGTLHEASAEPSARIVLRNPGGRLVTSNVPLGRSDEVLLKALQRGWSVVRVNTPAAK